MIYTASLLFLLHGLALAEPVLIQGFQRQKELSQVDEFLAREADRFCEIYADLETKNLRLKVLGELCQSGAFAHPATATALAAEGQHLSLEQDFLLRKLSFLAAKLSLRGETQSVSLPRGLTPGCALPGILRWPADSALLSYEEKNGGFQIRGRLPRVSWNYRKKGLRSL